MADRNREREPGDRSTGQGGGQAAATAAIAAASVPIPQRTYGFSPHDFDPRRLPDFETEFVPPEDIEAFVQALAAPDPLLQSPSPGNGSSSVSDLLLRSPGLRSGSSFDITQRPPSIAPSQDEAQQVAAHAAAAAADLTAPTSSQPQLLEPKWASQYQQQQNNQHRTQSPSIFITAQNDWAPVNEKVIRSTHNSSAGVGGGARQQRARKSKQRAARKAAMQGRRTTDETREGYLYGLLKWPFLLFVGAWIISLAIGYLLTRMYVFLYEHFVAWRGTRERLRQNMQATSRYQDWVAAARQLDDFLGNTQWREVNEYAYYDSKTVRRVWDQMGRCRAKAEAAERGASGAAVNGSAVSDGVAGSSAEQPRAIDDLKALVEACVKNNFVGIENPRLYSQTYYGTKNLVQNFIDEVEKSLEFLLGTQQIGLEEKRLMFKRLHANFGRTALCLSGGASFAYYHFGVVKALLEEDLLPNVITGTSGGALVAGLVATRTNEELKELLIPALAHRITACKDPFSVWFRRWWNTGARFDSVEWARLSSWWTHGSMTFREAFERTGRILNVSCVPADPHSPTILCNYLTSPDCVIWSAVLASAAVPGILNPVVLMMKTHEGTLVPYSFGHKWKDGSLRTDIPIKALNLHFNVNFTIVSQVNPHVNLFFFSSRGTVGSPVTHRRGRGWRGGYLGSATEQYIKLDLTKWLKVLRHLELLPRPLGQDWSQLWLQQFSGTITIWPRSEPSDFVHILSDPDPARLARMLHEGQQGTYPKIKFIANRLRVERLVERGRRETRPAVRRGSIESIISEEDLRGLLLRGSRGGGNGAATTTTGSEATEGSEDELTGHEEDDDDDHHHHDHHDGPVGSADDEGLGIGVGIVKSVEKD